MYFQVLVVGVALLGALLFVLPCVYLYRPKHKYLVGLIMAALIVMAFLVGLYFLYAPFPFEEGLRAYDIFKSYYIDLFGLLWGFLVAIPILVLAGLVVFVSNRFSPKLSAPTHESRRTLLKGLACLIPLAALGGGIVGARKGQEELLAVEQNFAFQDLPTSLENYRLVQISDVHMGSFIDMDDFDAIASKVLALRPHRLVITGDLIDDVNRLPLLVKRLQALGELIPHGIDYIYGNHEHFRNYQLVKDYLGQTSMRILDNQNIQIFDGPKPVYIAGVNYDLQRDPKVREAFLAEAMKGVPKEAFTILLAHHPEFFDQAAAYHIPLTLSGHTHGGQMVVADQSLVPVGTPYVRGRYERDGAYCYVNAGTGHWYPVRINCPREITLITFSQA